MAQIGFLASSLLTGVLLLAILGLISRLRNWQRNAAASAGGGAARPTTGDRLEGAIRSPTSWIVGFLGLVLVFGGGAVLFVAEPSVPGLSQSALQLGLAAAFLLVFVVYLFLGVYVSARARGQKSSFAAMIGAWVLGLLLVAAISFQLLVAG